MSVLVGKPAPEFEAPAVLPDGSIVDDFKLSDFKGRCVALLFWPLDFTFVCPSEIIAHDHRHEQFKERNVQVIGVSIDSKHTHYAWRNTDVKDGGIGRVKFPIVSDINHSITQAYGIEHPEDYVVMRATFLIDKDGIVQHQAVNNLPPGRNVDELIRMADALQFHEENNVVCPEGWQKCDKGMKETAESAAGFPAENEHVL